MQNLKLTLTGLTFLSLATLAGCSFPGVYKIDIQQGNVVTQDMIDQLRPGMTRRQVRFIMGSPLITDTFHANRWDYLYSMQPGGGQRQQERVSLVFDDSDHLVGLAGDFKPGVTREQEIMGTSGQTAAPEASSPTDQPAQQPPQQPEDQPPAPGSVEEQIQQEIDRTQATPIPTPAPIDTQNE
ncbi:outer membrane protein assembly factor BamE [Pseudomonas asuensis]|uniref:Outer membrane protein assembly factor BamE n=1 Tax=Pseudomonas asuensis TaxID=1825787 RepID=A0ABQ2H3X5_9PSED|nr:outer membrane protein assembly factor BamE [Pseudomonas asuensis]GGM28456.1 outer membrane protein assembly factor BamE [Pseudomonas asuensis]